MKGLSVGIGLQDDPQNGRTEILRHSVPQNDNVRMVAASCKYPISWKFADRNSHSSFSPMICHSEPRSGEESPTHQKNETQRAIGDRPYEYPRT